MNKNTILLSNGYFDVEHSGNGKALTADEQVKSVATVISNMAHYGFVPSSALMQEISVLSPADLYQFWQNFETAAKSVTGDDRNMGDFVVYKNFPREVLEMSDAQYWFSQILMYWGLPNEWFTEEVEAREPMETLRSLKVVGLADDNTLSEIRESLMNSPARWTDEQKATMTFLMNSEPFEVDVDAYGFKENAILMAQEALPHGTRIRTSNATDVLRFAAALSDGDISLRSNVKFAKFSRGLRRTLVGMLEESKNLVEDFGLRPEAWKRLLSRLHPNEFKAPRVAQAYDKLYRGDYETLTARLENGFKSKDISVLKALQVQPGNFMRRLHHAYSVFGHDAIVAFKEVIPELTTSQLLKLDGYLSSINERTKLIFAPKGNWTKAQIVDNTKKAFAIEDLRILRDAISSEIGDRLHAHHPEGFDVSEEVHDVKIQTNDQELAPYGRGTAFTIPEEMTFIRTASYWKYPTNGYGNMWYDNGWNFFDENWKDMGAVCWNDHAFKKGAVFSGDPTNSKDLQGRACQMIDLYPEKLLQEGVRYAVWNVLCFSHKTFNEAEEVLATLQWGEQPQKGKLYEPSRAQMVFPLKGNNLTKYVAYVDLQERKLVYMDANLYGNVQSASQNGAILSEKMPAFIEYLKSLPSVANLFEHGKKGNIPVVLTDEQMEISGPAYVFDKRNPENEIEPLKVNEILASKKPEVQEELEIEAESGFKP